MVRRRSGQPSELTKEAADGAGQVSTSGELLPSSGLPEMPPIETDPATHRADNPILIETSASVHHEAAAELTTELLETASISALELALAGAAERDADVAPDVAVDRAGQVRPEAHRDDASIPVSEPADLALQPVTTAAASPHGSQLHTGEALQLPEASYTPPPTSLTFAQAALQMNTIAWEHFRAESAARLACLQALGSTRTPSQIIDLQTREMMRALDAAVRFGEAFAAPVRELLAPSKIPPKAAA